MVGQSNIISRLNLLSADNINHSMLFIGEKGCGKHLLSQMISEKLNVPITTIVGDLQVKLNELSDYILNLYSVSSMNLYTINFDTLQVYGHNENGVKGQDSHCATILKIIEEPPTNCYFIITSSDESLIPDTIKNRCDIWRFSPYSMDELKEFTDDELILSLATTPGQVKALSTIDVKSASALCENIFRNIGKANIANILYAIPSKINFTTKDDDRIPWTAFSKILYSTANSMYKNKLIPIEAFLCTKVNIDKINRRNVIKDRMFEHYLVDLKHIMKGGTNDN